jgi:hypothetical protein
MKYRTITWPVLYGCSTWSLTFREERWLRCLRIRRGVFGPKRDEVTGEWRNLHNGELNDLNCTLNIARVTGRMRWARHLARMGEGRCVYRVLAWRAEGNRTLGRAIRRWKCNISMDLRAGSG